MADTTRRAPLRIALSVPRDTRYLQTVHDVVLRLAEFAGAGPGDAERVALAVQGAVAEVAGTASGASAAIDVTVAQEDGRVEIDRCAGCERRHITEQVHAAE